MNWMSGFIGIVPTILTLIEKAPPSLLLPPHLVVAGRWNSSVASFVTFSLTLVHVKCVYSGSINSLFFRSTVIAVVNLIVLGVYYILFGRRIQVIPAGFHTDVLQVSTYSLVFVLATAWITLLVSVLHRGNDSRDSRRFG